MTYGDADRDHTLRLIPPTTATLLDVGSGSGHFLEATKAIYPDIETWAIDPNQDCSQRPGVDHFILGHYPADIGPITFDTIVFNDVLEHLVDPWQVLRDTVDRLSPDGLVLASIPNIRHYSVLRPLLVQGQFTYREMGILDRTHLRFFTLASACDLFTQAGYEIVTASYARISDKGVALTLLRAGGRLTVPFRARHLAIAAKPN